MLSRALARLREEGYGSVLSSRPELLVGLEAPDDAAIVQLPAGARSVHTIDFFRAVTRDPFLFGRVAAVHALGDVWAMGAEPVTALALAVVPYGPDRAMEEDLLQMLAGAASALADAGCALAGGHSAESDAMAQGGGVMAMGLSVHGMLSAGQRALCKSGVQPGDELVLTKPLGTGALLAADMRGQASAQWIAAAFSSMQAGSGEAARVLIESGARACTDVTGFGLLGHALELVRASGCGAALDLGSLPVLPGALECLDRGLHSSLSPANERLARAVANFAEVQGPGAPPSSAMLLFDPQTSGGLLAAVPADRSLDCVARLHRAGFLHAAVVGRAVRIGDGRTTADAPIALTGWAGVNRDKKSV